MDVRPPAVLGPGRAMIELFPGADTEVADVLGAVAAEERLPQPERPWVLTNMIATADGATSLGGLSGGLGRPADKTMFGALRAVADAIMVGAATVRQERYRPPVPSEPAAAARANRGQAPRPLLVVVSASLSLDTALPLFADPSYRPLIATVDDAPARRRDELAEMAEVVTVGTGQVDATQLVRELAERGMEVVLAEGGPSLNGQLVADELVDEWNLTISPILAAGVSARAAHGPDLGHPTTPMKLGRVWQGDDLLFCRWVRASGQLELATTE